MGEIAVPILRVSDGRAAIAWYSRLGFEVAGEHRFAPDLPLYVFLRRGQVQLHLSEHAGDAPPGSLVYLWVDDIDTVAAEFGAEITEQPWGREVELTDADANRLRVGSNPTTPVLDQVNIVVSDMDRAVRFYEQLGLELPAAGTPWDAHHRQGPTPVTGAEVELDTTTFAAEWARGRPADTPGVVLDFRVATRAEVDEIHDRLVASGGRSQQEPYDTFWGSRFAVVEDPDGQAIGIMSRPDPTRRGAPPVPAPPA